MMISRRLWEAVQLSGKRRYELAREAGIHPNVLSQILHGMRPIRRGDPKVLQLGRLLGLTADEIFAETGDQQRTGIK